MTNRINNRQIQTNSLLTNSYLNKRIKQFDSAHCCSSNKMFSYICNINRKTDKDMIHTIKIDD